MFTRMADKCPRSRRSRRPGVKDAPDYSNGVNMKHEKVDRDTSALSGAKLDAECKLHSRLTADALAALAPTAADGHVAHMILYVASHVALWRRGVEHPPRFITHSKLGAAIAWPKAERQAADPAQRAVLLSRRAAGQTATTHLVGLAEPMIARVVRRLAARSYGQSAVVDLDDMFSAARSGVAQGVWAYSPSTATGPHYLLTWIEERIKREILGQTYVVTVPVASRRRHLQVAAARAALAERIGREPTDDELLISPFGIGLDRRDLDDERDTRHLRQRALPEMVAGDVADPTQEVLPERTDAEPGWRHVIQQLPLNTTELDLIMQYSGLPPYDVLDEAERSAPAIARRAGTTRHAVHGALRRARRHLTAPGGSFHRHLLLLSAEDREGLGLGDFLRAMTAPKACIRG
jgi:hypothetical protein